MTVFTYNYVNNANIGHKSSNLNYKYYEYIIYKYNIDLYFKSKLVAKLLAKLKNYIIIYWKNIYYI